MLLHVHRNRKAHVDRKLRTATSTFTQLLNSAALKLLNRCSFTGRTSAGFSHEPSSGCSANLRKIRRTQFVLNWANSYFTNLLRGFRRTATKLYSGSKTLRSTCSGNCSPSSWNLASHWLRAVRALLWMRKKGVESKCQMDDGVNISLATEGSDLSVD